MTEIGVDNPIREIDKGSYFAMLPEVDKSNLERIVDVFEEVMRERGRRGVLLAVGGTLTKPLPRPDIDVVLLLENDEGDPKRDDYPDLVSLSVADFRITEDLVGGMAEKSNDLFEVKEIIEPYPDHEHPEFPAIDGRISTQLKAEGTPIDFIRSARRIEGGNSNIRKVIERPYVVLRSV